MKFLVFDTGCIECREDSAVIGIFSNRKDAEIAREVAGVEQEKKWHGYRHTMQVLELPGE